jgi:nucleoside-diphosphate-sugar epimerase
MLRTRLARPGRVLRLLDVVPLSPPPGPGEEAVTASVTDMAAMTAACGGAAAVIHLGGMASEGAWAPILDVNINGTYTVFEAARRAGVPRASRHLLRGLQGGGRGARRPVCPPLRP